MIKRKIITASVSGSLYAFILSIIMPDPFNANEAYTFPSIINIVNIFPIYLLYSFPVILVYGILTSILSDKLAAFFSRHMSTKIESLISFVLHLFFGLILMHISLIAAFLFFITDKWLNIWAPAISWKKPLLSLLIPVSLFTLAVAIMNLLHVAN